MQPKNSVKILIARVMIVVILATGISVISVCAGIRIKK